MPADFVERYHRNFPRPAGGVTGEWTPRYMYDHWSLRLLRRAAPEARILVILRDPIERYRSALEAWRPLIEGDPRIARPAYVWTRESVATG